MKSVDLIDHVATAAGLEMKSAKLAVEAMLSGIIEATRSGSEVNLSGFGKFRVKDSPARLGRNPGTGEAIEIAASRKLTFVPAKQVKDALAATR